jgi:hypothetical protein
MIIAAYAGTGKTTLSRLCPETVVDFVWYITAFERDAYRDHIVLRDDQFLSDVIRH